MQILSLLFSPRGAISRGQFAWGLFVASIAVMVIFALLWLFLTVGFIQDNKVTIIDVEATVLALRSMHTVENYHFTTPYTQAVLAIFLIAKFSFLWIHICLVLKRLSDLDVSRRWALLFYFFTIPGWINLPDEFVIFKYICGAGLAISYSIFFLWGSRVLHEAERPTPHTGLVWLLFSTKGVATRMQFFAGMITSIAFLYLVFLAFSKCFEHFTNARLSPDASVDEMIALFQTYHLLEIGIVILGSATVCTLWIQLCVILKRLSDLMLTRWLAVIPFIIPGLYMLRTQLAASNVYINIEAAVNFIKIVVLCFFLLLLIWPSRRKSVEI